MEIKLGEKEALALRLIADIQYEYRKLANDQWIYDEVKA